MAYPKRIANNMYRIEDKAMGMYSGLLDCVSGYIPKKYSIEEVLQGKGKKGEDILWLTKAYRRICEFAENSRLKQMPTKVEGTGENGAFKLIIEIADENKAAPETGNRISQYIEV